MTAPLDLATLEKLAEKLFRDISQVESLVRTRGYGTEADKPATLARLESWRDMAAQVRASLPALLARLAAAETPCVCCRSRYGDGCQDGCRCNHALPTAPATEPATT